MITSDIQYAEELTAFKKQYDHLVSEYISSDEHVVLTEDTFEKYIADPFFKLNRIYIENPGFSEILPNSTLSLLSLNFNDFFESVKELPYDEVEKVISNMNLDPFFTHDILDSLKKNNFEDFYKAAKDFRQDFSKLASKFLHVYINHVDSKPRLEEDKEDFTDVNSLYIFLCNRLEGLKKNSVLNCLDEEDLKDVFINCLIKFRDDSYYKVRSLLPRGEYLDNNNFFDWHNKQYLFLRYIDYQIQFYLADIKEADRILWHPFTIGFKLRWSSIFFDLPEEYRIIKNDFFLKEQDSNKEEYINFTIPEFEKAGEKALARFMEICPLKNDADNLNYLTFVYRITGRNRPDVEILPTDILFPESAAYIYSFIEGIRDHKKSEDVYGKIKRFFSTTFFPDNEGDIANPVNDWKDALSELYPSIFGDSKTSTLNKKRTDDNAPNHNTLKLPKWMSQMTDDEAKARLAEIGEEFFPGQNFVKLFYYEPATTEPLVWNDEFGALTYFFRVLYAGEVTGNKISISSNIPKSETPYWKLIQKRFKNSDGKYSTSLGTTALSSLQKRYEGRIDPRFIRFLPK